MSLAPTLLLASLVAGSVFYGFRLNADAKAALAEARRVEAAYVESLGKLRAIQQQLEMERQAAATLESERQAFEAEAQQRLSQLADQENRLRQEASQVADLQNQMQQAALQNAREMERQQELLRAQQAERLATEALQRQIAQQQQQIAQQQASMPPPQPVYSTTSAFVPVYVPTSRFVGVHSGQRNVTPGFVVQQPAPHPVEAHKGIDAHRRHVAPDHDRLKR